MVTDGQGAATRAAALSAAARPHFSPHGVRTFLRTRAGRVRTLRPARAGVRPGRNRTLRPAPRPGAPAPWPHFAAGASARAVRTLTALFRPRPARAGAVRTAALRREPVLTWSYGESAAGVRTAKCGRVREKCGYVQGEKCGCAAEKCGWCAVRTCGRADRKVRVRGCAAEPKSAGAAGKVRRKVRPPCGEKCGCSRPQSAGRGPHSAAVGAAVAVTVGECGPHSAVRVCEEKCGCHAAAQPRSGGGVRCGRMRVRGGAGRVGEEPSGGRWRHGRGVCGIVQLARWTASGGRWWGASWCAWRGRRAGGVLWGAHKTTAGPRRGVRARRGLGEGAGQERRMRTVRRPYLVRCSLVPVRAASMRARSTSAESQSQISVR